MNVFFAVVMRLCLTKVLEGGNVLNGRQNKEESGNKIQICQGAVEQYIEMLAYHHAVGATRRREGMT